MIRHGEEAVPPETLMDAAALAARHSKYASWGTEMGSG